MLDSGDDETLEGIDTTPGALIHTADDTDTQAATASNPEHRRLLAFAKRAEQLTGSAQDRKLAAVTEQVNVLLNGGDSPIVFCRFIHTADYVAEHLATTLGSAAKPVHIAAVTGELPPAERERRVAELTERDGALRARRHRLPVRGCQPAGSVHGRRALRPRLEPHSP